MQASNSTPSSQVAVPPTTTLNPTSPPVMAPQLMTVMTFGDSNTYGTIPGGYRKPLAELLASNGLAVQFVGGHADTRMADLLNSYHDGYSGWAIDDLLNGMNGLFPMDSVSRLQPDTILLMAGTNDFVVKNRSLSEAQENMKNLISQIRIRSPKSRILVATIFPIVNTAVFPRTHLDAFNDRVVGFNQWLSSTVKNLADTGLQISLVDMYSFEHLDWLADGLHPNEMGYKAAAQAWYSALAPWVASDRGASAPNCVASQASRTYVMTSLRFFAAASNSPLLADDAKTFTSQINKGIEILIATNWACKDTANVAEYVKVAVEYLRAKAN